MNDVIIAPDLLRAWTARVFERAGVPQEDARIAADVLVSADVRGVDTHGVALVPLKLKQIRAGALNPAAQIRIEQGQGAFVRMDGDNGIGMVVGVHAMREAITRAREQGMACVTVRRSNHFAMAAYYSMLASAQNMIGISMTNTNPGMPPFGSKTPYLGSNPIAFAAPGPAGEEVVLDMATSQVAWGKIAQAARQGKEIPLNWAADRDGNPTSDPGEARMVMPLGGYKGYALAMMVDILSGVLSGAAFGGHVAFDSTEPYQPQNAGHFFAAIDIAKIMPMDEFQLRLGQMVAEIHSGERAANVERIYVPGGNRTRNDRPTNARRNSDFTCAGE